MVHGLDQLQRHGLGQVADQVGEVVELHVLGGRQQFVGVHALDERLAHVLAELDQHVAFDFGLDEVPDHFALRGRQRFDEQRDLRRMHGGDHARRAAPRTLAQRAAQRGEAAFFSGDAVVSTISARSVMGTSGEMGTRVEGVRCPSDRTRTGMSSLFAGPFVSWTSLDCWPPL